MEYTVVLLQTIGNIEAGPSEVIVLVFFCLLFFFISAVCCGGEQAFSYLDEKDVNMLKAKENNNSRRVSMILERPRLLMVTLLIARVISNLLLIFMLNALIDFLVSVAKFPTLSVFVKVVVIFFLLVLFCETLPRSYARQKKIRMAFFAAPLVSSLLSILEPLALALIDASDWMSTRIFRKKSELLSIKDIDQAFTVSLNRKAGAEEKNILRSLVQFEDITVRQIMRTRMDIYGIAAETSFHELIALVHQLNYSRLPVYGKDLDEIIGIINVKDLIRHLDEEDFDWQTLMKQTVFVHEQKLVKDLLKDFQAQRIHFAIVVDEFGGTSGIVTMEDIMEEIIGDIRDEFDTEEQAFTRLSDNEYIFEGKTMLNEVGRVLELPTDFFDEAKGESDSLGGLILELSGSFPEINETIPFQGLELVPLAIQKMRITKVKIVDLTAR